MAVIHVEVPDGEFCSDKGHLDCKFASHQNGVHYCHLHGQFLDKLEEFIVDGEKRRLRRKCKSCLNTLNEDMGSLAIKVDMEDRTDDKNK